MTRTFELLVCGIAATLLGATGTAIAEGECKGVVLPIRTTKISPAIAKVADSALRERLSSATGCTLVDEKGVGAMRKMLRLPRVPGREDLLKLAKGLLASWAIAATLEGSSGKGGKAQVKISITTCTVASGTFVEENTTAPPDEALHSLVETARKSLGVVDGAGTADAANAAGPEMEPPAATPAPPSTDEVEGSSHGHDSPRAAATTPSPVDSRPTKAKTVSTSIASSRSSGLPATRSASAPPAHAAKSPEPTAASIRASSSDPLGPNLPHLAVGTALRVFHLFSSDRTGPALDVELGMVEHRFRLVALFRPYFGDRTSYLAGVRIEGGPRWGRVRLSFGIDLGLMFVPDTDSSVDMVVAGFRAAGVVVTLPHVVLTADVFTFDLYLVPGDAGAGKDPDAFVGCSSGLGAMFFF